MDEYKQIRIDQIAASDDFNCRKSYDDVDKLAAQIEMSGQLSPILVKELEPESIGSDGKPYFLVFGFRRVRALLSLEREMVTARIWHGEDEAAYFVNLAENVARTKLKPWEKAERFSELKKDFKLSANEISRRLSIDKTNVANLIRIIDKGNPKIIKLWKEGHSKASVARLSKYVICPGFDHEEQWQAWLKECGLDDASTQKEIKDAIKLSDNNTTRTRLRPRHYRRALDALAMSDKRSQYQAGARAALLWVLGETPSFSNVYDSKKKAKK
tara:strand:+ start:17028 stop:17840 length:813 start_codon:yes stop_codon:yes gene_type:complete